MTAVITLVTILNCAGLGQGNIQILITNIHILFDQGRGYIQKSKQYNVHTAHSEILLVINVRILVDYQRNFHA